MDLDNPNVRITQVYSKALSHFRTQTTVMIVYSFAKITSAIVLTVVSASEGCEWDLIDLWLVLVGLQSVINLWCYWAIQQIMKDLKAIVKIADDLQQTIYLPPEDNMIHPISEDDLIAADDQDPNIPMNQQEESKKISILSMQIKYEVPCEHVDREASRKNAVLKWIGQFVFLFNQALIVMGFVIEFTLPEVTLNDQAQECKGPTLIFMFVFLVLSVYQYIDLYVIIVLILICLPFVLIFLAYQMIKTCQQKRKNQSFALRLERSQIKYVPGLLQGDAECHICMSNYNLEENIIVLPCNPLHHFHAACISAWLKVSTSCPLCRKNFAEEEDQLNQQLINQRQDLGL